MDNEGEENKEKKLNEFPNIEDNEINRPSLEISPLKTPISSTSTKKFILISILFIIFISMLIIIIIILIKKDNGNNEKENNPDFISAEIFCKYDIQNISLKY